MTEALMQLWQRCFGDGPEDIQAFFQTAYAPERCMTLWEGEHLAAALYWLDCQWAGQKLAYLYAVGTDPDFRGRGLCRELMAKTHTRLEELGYYAPERCMTLWEGEHLAAALYWLDCQWAGQKLA